MLETEEVDVDFFTPASNTSLSKIFSGPVVDNSEEKSSLKYVPPLPPETTSKQDDSKPTKCLYAGALHTFQWLGDNYVSRGRLGFAIMLFLKNNTHNIVLYDSKKITLSHVTLNSKLIVYIKENTSVSYYDNQHKYWTVYTNLAEYNQILDILKGLKIQLKDAVDIDAGPPEDKNIMNKETAANQPLFNSEDKESDTDSSMNRKTKDSIMKRMATMGHSVLPHHMKTELTSDSSDTNEPHVSLKPRPRPMKALSKKSNIDNRENDNKDLLIKTISSNNANAVTDNETHLTNAHDYEMIPVKTNEIIGSSIVTKAEGSDLNLFIAEQKINNSESRINMTRISDKLDILVDKIKDLCGNTNVSHNVQFQNEIFQKLLGEYENKIKRYEEFINLRGFDCNTLEAVKKSSNDSLEELKQNSDIAQLLDIKDMEILTLKNELAVLTEKCKTLQIHWESRQIKETNDLKKVISDKNEELSKVHQQLNNLRLSEQKNDNITSKLKEIMNETFQAIAMNFDGENNYSGAQIKTIVAQVIKKTTIESLSEI